MIPFKHHKTSLFLIEMLFSVFILAVSAAAVAHVFSISYTFQRDAMEMEHAKELLTVTAELLDGTDGNAEDFLSFLPGGTRDEDVLIYYYDKHFSPCAAEDAVYEQRLLFSKNTLEKTVLFSIHDMSGRFYLEQELRSFLLPTFIKEDLP